jgi:crossover junction endodeoxyribonuclease RuvC
VRIFGIDPGSVRTGFGCVESDGSRHRLVRCGAIAAPARLAFPERLHLIHRELAEMLADCRPDAVAVESVFHAVNARSALQLGHARGVALLAACQAGLAVTEYPPAEVKRAVVGYGRAEKHQVQQMIKLLLGLERAPSPHDVADALAVAICHLQSSSGAIAEGMRAAPPRSSLRSWRDYRPAVEDRTRLRARAGSRSGRAPSEAPEGSGRRPPPSERERGWGPASTKK